MGEKLPDFDHSPYQVLQNPLVSSEKSLVEEVLKDYPQYDHKGKLSVDENSPLVAGDRVLWIPTGIIDQFPSILQSLDEIHNWVLVEEEKFTDNMKTVATRLLGLLNSTKPQE